MGITGDKRFYSYMRKRVVLMRTSDSAKSYRESDIGYQSAEGNKGESKFAFIKSSGAAFRAGDRFRPGLWDRAIFPLLRQSKPARRSRLLRLHARRGQESGSRR